MAAVVVFYGTEEADFAKSQASFLGHYAENHEWEPMEGFRKLENLLLSAGRETEFHMYPGVKHWFFEKTRPEYNDEAASLAWSRTLDFLRARL